jgi:Fe-S cluster biogenesis protein NfuA
MKLTEQNVIQFLLTEMQPKIRVDGGDVAFERLDGTTIHLGAHAECAICPATAECLKWWCEQEFSEAFGQAVTVAVHLHVPYFER